MSESLIRSFLREKKKIFEGKTSDSLGKPMSKFPALLASQYPQGGASYPGKSCDFSGSYLKGLSSKIFEPPWAHDQWVKIFMILAQRFCRVNQIFRKNLPGIYCGESISPWYATPGSQKPILKMFVTMVGSSSNNHTNMRVFIF